jgi:hypothetical protein
MSVLDKVLLGSVALGVAHYLNRHMEIFRARRALEGEFLRERTKRLDELYTLMLDFAAAMDTFVIERGRRAPDMGPFDTAVKDVEDKSGRLLRLSMRYGPWIGDELRSTCLLYTKLVANTATELMTPSGRPDTTRIDEFQHQTNELLEAIIAAIRRGAPPSGR